MLSWRSWLVPTCIFLLVTARDGCCIFYWLRCPRPSVQLYVRICVQVTVAKQQLSDDRRHFDVVVACEDEDQEDLDVPLVSIRYK